MESLILGYILYIKVDADVYFTILLHSFVLIVCEPLLCSSKRLSGISLLLMKRYLPGSVVQAPICKHFLAFVGKF